MKRAGLFWELLARLGAWWSTDAWGWLLDVPCSDPDGGHCTGRRTGQRVYCPDCDGPRPKLYSLRGVPCARCRRPARLRSLLVGESELRRAVCGACLEAWRFHVQTGRLRVEQLDAWRWLLRWWRRWEIEINPRPDWDRAQIAIIDWRWRECHSLDVDHEDVIALANGLIEKGRIPRKWLRLEYGGSVCQVLEVPGALRHRLYDLLLTLPEIIEAGRSA